MKKKNFFRLLDIVGLWVFSTAKIEFEFEPLDLNFKFVEQQQPAGLLLLLCCSAVATLKVVVFVSDK